MAQTALTACSSSCVCGADFLSRKSSNLSSPTFLAPGVDRQSLHHKTPKRFVSGQQTIHLRARRSFSVRAGWLFSKGEDRGSPEARCEHSESTNEDILIFFFQLDLATQVQRALNLEQYEFAQQLRNKLTEVEKEVVSQIGLKRGLPGKSEAQDKSISMLRLRAELQGAVEGENYALAAEIRDKITKLEAETVAASASSLLYDNVRYGFRLGQKVRHKIFGYQAVICGMDPVCCESSSWAETAGVEKLSRGLNQPFYQVLVDVHEDPNLLVAYVAEDNLVAPEEPDLGRFDHPYLSFLFYGADAAGDFIPIKQLREKFNRPRYEVPMEDGDDEGGEDS
uniref:Hemimethylated DNA-binding domain-containing protein n=1 Tax=Kalanchoe fedtschenkoi TaxID=63787 RepID=A0A7N0TRG6_KALFE